MGQHKTIRLTSSEPARSPTQRGHLKRTAIRVNDATLTLLTYSDKFGCISEIRRQKFRTFLLFSLSRANSYLLPQKLSYTKLDFVEQFQSPACSVGLGDFLDKILSHIFSMCFQKHTSWMETEKYNTMITAKFI